jgi:hypothetical protein
MRSYTQQHPGGRNGDSRTSNANDVTAPDCGNEIVKGQRTTGEHIRLRHDLQLRAVRVQVHETQLA